MDNGKIFKYKSFINYKNLNENYEFDYNCVNPKDEGELDYIIDNMEEISVDEFLKNVSLEEVNNSLMYGMKYNTKEQLKKDWSVRFHKLNEKDINVYVMVHSAIEYVFKYKS